MLPSKLARSFSKILIIKLKLLGDLVLMTPVLRTLRRHCPESEIDLVVPSGSENLFFSHPSQVKVHPMKRKRDFRAHYNLLTQHYDLILNLSETSRGHLISLFHPRALKIALHPGCKPKKIFSIYEHLVRHGPNTRHQVERDLDALRWLQMEIIEEDKSLQLGLNPTSLLSLQEKLLPHLQKKGSYIVIQPTSRKEFKQLPATTMAQVGMELKKRGYSLILSVGKAPHELRYIEMMQKEGNSVFDQIFAGDLTLQELCHLIERAKGILSVDSLAVHLASCFKTPHLALFGPTADLRWGPWMNPNGGIKVMSMPCRPCLLEGCGNSSVSECLIQMKAEEIVDTFLTHLL